MRCCLSQLKNTQPRREHGDIRELKASIREVGLIHPPTVDENLNLLAGRRRYQALLELYGPDHEVEVTVLPTNGDKLRAFKVAIVENLRRKNLSAAEEAVAIKEYDDLGRELEGEAKAGGDRQSIGQTLTDGWSYQKTAADLGVSKSTVVRAIKITTAIERYPDLAGLPSGQAVLREYQRREVQAPSLPTVEYADTLHFLHSAVADLPALIDAETIDCILTDPPYTEGAIALYSELAHTAAHLLKPGGSLVVMCGQFHFPRTLQALMSNECLTYHWLVSYLTPGGQAVQIFPRKVTTFWKPVVWLTKGNYSGEWVGDVARSPINDNDKRFHPQGQSESGIRALVEMFTTPGQLVLDPFMGGGTTAAACLNLGRRYIGADIDAAAIATSRQRLGLQG